jgi:hypothetical protein
MTKIAGLSFRTIQFFTMKLYTRYGLRGVVFL